MASKLGGGADLKSAKIKLKSSKGTVTKALNEIKESGSELEKAENSSNAKKLRLAARLMDNLQELHSKVKKMENATEATIESMLECEDDELSKSKEDLAKEYEAETNKYLKEYKDTQIQLESIIEKAEEIISGAGSEPVSNQARQPTAENGGAAAVPAPQPNNDFRPHANLKPNFLEKNATHLEVKMFIEQVEPYIRTGFRSAPPQGPTGVWFHMKACMHSTWYVALEQQGVLEQSFEKILQMIMEESGLRNPVHSRRMGFLQRKRGNMSHSDFWAYLEEQIPLLKFQDLTVVGLAAHIFLQEADPVMRKMMSEHFEETGGKADARKLSNQIKGIEASQWYDARSLGKKVGAGRDAGAGGGAGARWCETCQSSSHSTEKCWGRCGTCQKFGHPTHLCWDNPNNRGPGGAAGAAKSAQAPPPTAPPLQPTPEEIAAKKAKQKEKNKKQALKRKEKLAKKKKEAEEAKRAAEEAGRSTPPPPPLTDSSTEEDSPRKSPLRSRTMRVLGKTAGESTPETKHNQ